MNLKEICQTLSREIQKLVPYDRLAINLPEREENYVRVYAEESRLPASAIPEGLSVREGTASGWVLDHHEPVICRDLLRDSRFPLTHKRYKDVGLRSYVILPLMAKGKALGALNLASLKPRCYGKKQVDILSPIAEILSLAVENSNLYEESQRLLKEQSALREIFTQINLLDLDTLLHQLTEQAVFLLQVDYVQVRLVDASGTLQTMAIAGPGSEYFLSQAARSGTKRSTWVMENLRPLVIKDVSQDKIYGPGRLMRERGVKGYLCVPLIGRDQKSIGVLQATSRLEREFTQEEIALAQQLAAGAAIAIENARLFEEVQRKSAELEEAFNAKSDFLNTMAHELRTPLNVVIGTGDLLLDGFFGEVKEEQRKALERISRHSQDLLSLINEILDLVRLESGKIPIYAEEFSVRQIAGDLEGSFGPLAQDKGLQLRVSIEDGLPTLKSDRSKIDEILQNLLANAVKYTDRGEIAVSASLQPGDGAKTDRILWSVRDSGIGIREADLPRVFEPFYMGEGMDRKKYPGTGLGLSIVKRLVELLNGEIRVESEWGKGSTFTVAIPVTHDGDS